MAKRKLTAKQIAAGFGGKAAKRGARKAPRRKARAPAQRRRRKSPVAKKPSRARRALSGIRARMHTKTMLAGAAAGAASPYVAQVAGPYGPGITFTAAGIASGSEGLQAIGAASLGGAIVRNLTAGTAAAPSGSVSVL